MAFRPTEFAQGAPPLIEDVSGWVWTPMFQNVCNFGPDIFLDKMNNFIRNPNLNSSWLFRADILDEHNDDSSVRNPSSGLRTAQFRNFRLEKALVRKLIPRNSLRDKPLDQSCLTYRSDWADHQSCNKEGTLVVYLPHAATVSDLPFYHPKVRGVAHLHEWDESTKAGLISIHYCLFDQQERPGEGHDDSSKLARTALNLLSVLYKHGTGALRGYVKQVHHDTLIPQIPIQTTYSNLKDKYARSLIQAWAEVTDPSKHVFEDLGIAAFLIELWKEIYRNKSFPGFVDIGCGNGLLVYILTQEGYTGWGFDARRRKSWEHYNSLQANNSESKSILREHVLLPSIIPNVDHAAGSNGGADGIKLHDGRFPKDTFIISNHADELTPWTPILATISECPYIMIPCCSHDLSGAKFRAPGPKKRDQSNSAFSSLVAWVSELAADCGWKIEKEALRIPSTRNIALLGRTRTTDYASIDLEGLVQKYGGTAGYLDNVMKLVKSSKDH